MLPELAVTLVESVPAHARPSMGVGPMTARQMRAVLHLARHGRLAMSDFAAGLEVSRGAASEMADRLVEKGLACREADPADRRRVYLRLAPAAARLADEALARWRGRIEAAFALHPDLDPQRLVAFLATLTDALRERSEQ